MSAKAYILLDVIDGKSDEALQALCTGPGIVRADPLEGHPNIIMVVEAEDRLRLADLIMSALSGVEAVTMDLRLFPVQSELTRTAA